VPGTKSTDNNAKFKPADRPAAGHTKGDSMNRIRKLLRPRTVLLALLMLAVLPASGCVLSNNEIVQGMVTLDGQPLTAGGTHDGRWRCGWEIGGEWVSRTPVVP